MSDRVYVWSMTDEDAVQYFILSGTLVAHLASAPGTKTVRWANLYTDPDKAQAALLGRTTAAEMAGLEFAGFWSLSTHAGPLTRFWLLSLSQSLKAPDGERAIRAIAEIVDDVILNGERLK